MSAMMALPPPPISPQSRVSLLLHKFDLLLNEVVLLSLPELRLVVEAVAGKLEEVRAEVGEYGEDRRGYAAGEDRRGYAAMVEENDERQKGRGMERPGQSRDSSCEPVEEFGTEGEEDDADDDEEAEARGHILLLLDENNLEIGSLEDGDDDPTEVLLPDAAYHPSPFSQFEVKVCNPEDITDLMPGDGLLHTTITTRTEEEEKEEETVEDEEKERPVFTIDSLLHTTITTRAEEEEDETVEQEEEEEEERPVFTIKDPTKRKPAECRLCSCSFKTQRSLAAHFSAVHPKMALFKCSHCEKAFRSQSGLKHHEEVSHTSTEGGGDGEEGEGLVEQDRAGEAYYQCEEELCNYKTKNRVRFRSHLYSHTVNVPLSCPVCGKEYLGGAKALKHHMKIHSSERSHPCPLCSKAFISKSRLTHHRNTVHGEPRYNCDQCSKLFRSRVNFERHARIHTEEKPYSCPYCSFQCNHPTNLGSHVRSVHKVVDYTAGADAKQRKKNHILKKMFGEDILEQVDNQNNPPLEAVCPVAVSDVSNSTSRTTIQLLTMEPEMSFAPVESIQVFVPNDGGGDGRHVNESARMDCHSGDVQTVMLSTSPSSPFSQPPAAGLELTPAGNTGSSRLGFASNPRSILNTEKRSRGVRTSRTDGDRERVVQVTNSRGDLVETVVKLGSFV